MFNTLTAQKTAQVADKKFFKATLVSDKRNVREKNGKVFQSFTLLRTSQFKLNTIFN